MSDQLERRRGHTLLKESEEKLVNRKTRANRMMIAMVLGFIFAWMPLNSINLYRDWSTFTNKPWFSTVFALCHVSAMTSAVLNPVIYSWFNPQFRASIKSLFHRKRSKAFHTHLQHTELYQSKIQTESFHSKLNTEIIPIRTELKLKSDFVMHNDCHQPGDQIL
uniref:G_PROTEIN_RECEP_F1_2 domain-containing protein n=1 Tax=Heterorhabditis bacteriophora TaxID=37862 RepID=A0A1I7WMX8_HETBA